MIPDPNSLDLDHPAGAPNLWLFIGTTSNRAFVTRFLVTAVSFFQKWNFLPINLQSKREMNSSHIILVFSFFLHFSIIFLFFLVIVQFLLGHTVKRRALHRSGALHGTAGASSSSARKTPSSAESRRRWPLTSVNDGPWASNLMYEKPFDEYELLQNLKYHEISYFYLEHTKMVWIYVSFLFICKTIGSFQRAAPLLSLHRVPGRAPVIRNFLGDTSIWNIMEYLKVFDGVCIYFW